MMNSTILPFVFFLVLISTSAFAVDPPHALTDRPAEISPGGVLLNPGPVTVPHPLVDRPVAINEEGVLLDPSPVTVPHSLVDRPEEIGMDGTLLDPSPVTVPHPLDDRPQEISEGGLLLQIAVPALGAVGLFLLGTLMMAVYWMSVSRKHSVA